MNGGWQLVGTGTALRAAGNQPKNAQAPQGNKKADGKDAHSQAGGSQAPVFLHRDLSAAVLLANRPPSIPPASSAPKQLLRGWSSPFVILPEWEDTQVSSRCLSGANRAQWFNPSPSARGEQSWSRQSCSAPPGKQTDPLQNDACPQAPRAAPERSLIVGLIQVLAVREREKHRPGALQDGISALNCPLWAQARVGGGSVLSPWLSAVCSFLEYSWC